MSKSEKYYEKLKIESSQYGQGRENTTDISNTKTMNHKTLEDVKEELIQEKEDGYEIHNLKESDDYMRGFNEAIRCALIITEQLKL